MKFSFTQIDPDLYLIEKDYTTKTKSHGSDITGPYWMFMEIKVLKGEIWWITDGKKKDPDRKKLFIYLPPYTWAM